MAAAVPPPPRRPAPASSGSGSKTRGRRRPASDLDMDDDARRRPSSPPGPPSTSRRGGESSGAAAPPRPRPRRLRRRLRPLASAPSSSSSPSPLLAALLAVVVLIRCAAAAASVDLDPGCGGSSSSRYRPLTCWLWRARVHLPDESIDEGLLTVRVTDLSCANFRVAGLKSTSTPSDPPATDAPDLPNPKVALELSGTEAKCRGKYALGGMFPASGELTAALTSPGSLTLTAGIASGPLGETKAANNGTAPDDKASLPLPASATLSECQPHFAVSDVEFSGSLSARVLDLFTKSISKKVTESVNQNICAAIKKKGEGVINEGLEKAKDYLGGLILDSPEAYLSQMTESELSNADEEESKMDFADRTGKKKVRETGAVTWDKDLPFLKRLLVGIDDFVSAHLDEGIFIELWRKLDTWGTFDPAHCEDCGFFFKGFNGLVKSIAKGESGTLEVDLPEKLLFWGRNYTFNIEGYGDVTLAARKLTLSGIDDLTDLSILRPVGRNALSSSVSSESKLSATLRVDLEVRPSEGGAVKGDALNETFDLRLDASNVAFSGSSAWDLDRDVFERLTVGSFLEGSYATYDRNRDPLNCVREALSSASILEMEGTVSLEGMKVTPVQHAFGAGVGEGGLEGDADDLINALLGTILKEYPATVAAAVAGLVRKPAKEALNRGLANAVDDARKVPLHCAGNDELDGTRKRNRTERPLRWDEAKWLPLLDAAVDGADAAAAANAFLACVDRVARGGKLFEGHFYDIKAGETTATFRDLKLENVDRVYDLRLLEPKKGRRYELDNALTYGKCPSDSRGVLGGGCDAPTSLSFGVNLAHATRGQLGTVAVRVALKDLTLTAGAEVKYDLNYLPLLAASDLLAHPQCLSVPLTTWDFSGLNATVGSLEVTMDVTWNGDDGAAAKTFKYETKDATALAGSASALMSEGATLLRETLVDASVAQVELASSVCETPPNPRRTNEKKRPTGSAGLWTFLIVLVFVGGNLWLFLRGFGDADVESEKPAAAAVAEEDGEARLGEEAEPGQSLTEPLLNDGDDRDEMDEKLEVDSPPSRKFPLASSSSLMYHPSIHPAVKFGVPAVLALAFVLFFSSNLSVGATVDLLVTRANGKSLGEVNVYAFGLGSTMREMARAGVYLLMLLILFCSGIWPYAKLVLLAASWMASARRLPPVKRERLLHLLDSLGKFSLIDAYVLVLMMVAFRYNLDIEGVGSLDVYVTPEYGFYGFLLATILSLVGGHVMLFLHRRTTMPQIPVYSGRYESLARHIYDDKHGRGLVKLTRKFRRTIFLLLLLTLVLICVGVGLQSFHFRFDGVAGTALGDDKVRSFSLATIGGHIPSSVRPDSSSFGIRWIQLCYFFFALVMPLACLLSLFVLFLVPMRLKQQQKVFMVAEVTNAWGAIEVFVIAIIASLVEISPFSESMVGEHCSLLNQILSGWSGGEGDNLHYCFDVKSSIDGSSAVLIIGVALNSLLVSTLHRFAHHAIWERIEREDRPDATEEENKTVRECVLAHKFVSRLRKRPRLGAFVFEEVSFGPHSEYEMDFENVAENEEPHTSNNFWTEWTKIVSVI